MSAKLEIVAALHGLLVYLAHHESDIALKLDDFGDLAPVFYKVFGRHAQEDA